VLVLRARLSGEVLSVSEAFNPADIGGEPTEPVVVDKRGTLMVERESYERVIEGLKMASDGAHHLTQSRQDTKWRTLAQVFDKIRAAVAKLGGMGTEGTDTKAVAEQWNAQHMGVHAAYDRVYRGLDMACKGARQIATCHRGDLRWSKYAQMIEGLRDQCGRLIRMRQAAKPQSSLILRAN
jgi:hypothetical protein